jgi:hypothetical protein
VPDERWEFVEKLVHADQDFVMIGIDFGGEFAGETKLAMFGLGVTDRKCFDLLAGHHTLHEGGDGGGIDAAAQEHAERDIAHETHADGFFDALTAFGNPRSIVTDGGVGGRRGYVPIFVV